jgi:hypothetical protein
MNSAFLGSAFGTHTVVVHIYALTVDHLVTAPVAG